MMSHSQYTLTEEKLHGVTHGIGAVLAIVGLVVLIVVAAHGDDIRRIVSFSIYGGSLTLLYLASTLYHSFQNERLKRFFRHLDHLSIFLLIAGTYTPVTLISLRGAWGWTLFVLIWGFATGGIVYELLFLGRHKWITVTIYLGMARHRRYKTHAHNGSTRPLMVAIGGWSVLHGRGALLCPQEDAIPPRVVASLRPFRKRLPLFGGFLLPDLIGHCVSLINE